MIKHIDLKTAVSRLASHIRSVFKQCRYNKGLIGLSGGVDSATSCSLAVHALGAKNIYPVLMPYGALNAQGVKDALFFAKWLKIPEANVCLVDIQPIVDAAVAALDPIMENGRKGNIMARMRMVVLYDFAKAMPALVVGTENKTEHLLGYYTKFGDEASDVEPLRQFYKTQVYELAQHLRVPKKIIEKFPTAGLWEDQTDEGEFGFTYKDVDAVLFLHFEESFSKEEIIKRGYDRQLIERMWWWISKGELKEKLPFIFQET